VRVLVLLGCLLISVPAFAAPAAKTGWAQDESDLPADPNVTFGELPNGLRYAVMHNAMPPGQVSFRLRFDAGSMMEEKGQSGLAHYLEHMAFRGSTHIKDGDVFKRMQRLGAALGADTNAQTGYDYTIYQFDLPKNDAASVSEAFLLLREIAGELKIDKDPASTERDVVLSEERIGDSPQRRWSDDSMSFHYRGLPLGDHAPIGSVEDLKKITPEQIRAFYHRWYRPERATLVIAGDIDPVAMVAEIGRRFGGWKGKGPAAPPLKRGEVPPRPAETHTHSEAGLYDSFSISWINSRIPDDDTRAEEHRRLVRHVANGAFNLRMADLAQGASPPFIGASVSASTGFYKAADVTSLGVHTGEETWAAGLRRIIAEWRRAERDGFTQAEIDRQLVQMRRGWETARDGASTRRTPNLAGGLLGAYGTHNVFKSPQQGLDLFEGLAAGVTRQEVNASFRGIFARGEPLFYAASPAPIEGIEAVYHEAMAAPVPADEHSAEPEKTWPYTDFGPAGKVVERSELPDLGITLVTFANGVRLTVKPTRFRDNEVLTVLTFGQGMAGQPKRGHREDLMTHALIGGGLKDLSLPEIRKIMADKVVGLSFNMRDTDFALGGDSTPKDFDTLMQWMTAQVSAPGWRPEALDQEKLRLKPWLDSLDTTMGGAWFHYANGVMHDGDPRWQVPTVEDLTGEQLQTLRGILDPSLKDGYLELAVVGNIEVERAIDAVGKTLGALPQRKPKEPLSADQRAISLTHAQAPVMLHHHGRADQAYVETLWPTTDRYAAGKAFFDLQMAQSILGQRLFEQFREKVGASYAPGAGSAMSTEFPSYGYFTASTETPPDKIPLFEQMLGDILADLKAHPVGADEFERARKPFIEQSRNAHQTNGYWLGWLQNLQSEPQRLALIRADDPDSWNAETPEAVQEAFRTYLTDDKALHVRLTAEQVGQ